MKTVLVVEDNQDNLELISIALRRSGYKVISAETGEMGVEITLRKRPYFVVMDIDLPGIDGFEATRRIRASKANGDIPIIAITSFAMRGDKEKIMAMGCNAYFEKPINPLTIVDDIEKIVQELEK
ncbi:MAG: response regulator [Desulfobulbaceae bacterium]|nr:response regulator [Desulfobulbaceae bacterium]